MRVRSFLLFACLGPALFTGAVSPEVMAANDDQNVVNYSYAVIFGTGAYKVRDQTAFVFRLPLSWQLREPTRDRPGINLVLPVLTGFYDYGLDDVFQASDPGEAATLSVVPGLEFDYVMNDRWRLKPYGQLGLGRDMKNSENSLIYVAGISSYYRLPRSGNWRFALGNSATYTAYHPDNHGAQSLGIFGLGVDMTYPWELRLFGADTGLATSLIYYLYLDNPNFAQGDNRSKSVTGEFEWSLALNFRQPRQFMGVEFDRVGLGLRYGDNIKGIRITTRFPF